MVNPNQIIIWLTLFLTIAISFIRSSDSTKVVERYYQGLNASDYTLISNTLLDTLIMDYGEFQTSYSREEYYQWFRWDSVFSPRYDLRKTSITGDTIRVTTDKFCKRIDFLIGGPLTTTIRFELKDGRIQKITEVAYDGNTDWNMWTSRRDSLAQWTDTTHPQLSGFLTEQNKTSAENYLEAIQLFQMANQ